MSLMAISSFSGLVSSVRTVCIDLSFGSPYCTTRAIMAEIHASAESAQCGSFSWPVRFTESLARSRQSSMAVEESFSM